MTLDKIKPYAKAVMAGVVAGAGAIATGYADETLSTGEIWMAVSAGLTAAGATWVIPNRDPKAEHQEESVQPPYKGDEPTTYDGMGAPVSNPEPLDAPNEDYDPRHIMRHDK